MWTITITPRFGDIDGLRHINNCNLPIWFESGREPLLRLFHPDLDLNHWNLIMAKISVDFVAQLRLGSVVTIKTFIKKIGRSSLTVYQEAWQNNQLGAKGDSVIVYYDFVNNKSMTIPDAIRNELQKHMLPDETPGARSKSGRFLDRGE